jgi:predicted transcriptional regulator
VQLTRTWLKATRLEKRYSTRQVAEFVGVARQNVTAWESGDKSPDRDNTYLLVDLLGPELHEHFAAEARANRKAKMAVAS